MEDFFDGADAMAKAMAYASAVATQGAPTKAPIPPSEPIFVKEGTQAEKVVTKESAPTPAEIPTPQKGVTTVGVFQTQSTTPATPFSISLSQAMKDGSSLVVTLSSIPSSSI